MNGVEFSLCGTYVKFEFSFLLILAFIALSDYTDALWVLFFSSLHECGHLVALILAGGKPSRLTFSCFGFALTYDSKLSPLREAAVLLSGPAVNLLLWIILRDNVNPVLFCLNMLPIYPLDGGRIAAAFVSPRALKIISTVFLFAVFALAVYLFLAYRVFSLLLIAVYLLISNKRYL